MLSSTTPAYAHRSDTGATAAQPTTSPSVATQPVSGQVAGVQPSQDGTSVSKVASPVAIPAA